jgi:hypothetical protein
VIKIIVVLMLVAILVSLFSALAFLYKKKSGKDTRTVRALTWRIGLSLTLFVLLMAGYYFGVIPPQGLSGGR